MAYFVFTMINGTFDTQVDFGLYLFTFTRIKSQTEGVEFKRHRQGVDLGNDTIGLHYGK